MWPEGMATNIRERVAPPGIGRQQTMESLLGWTKSGQCCSLIGVSNVGKSALFRSIHETGSAQWKDVLFVYADCNRMLGMSEQGLYELLLRCVLDELCGSPDMQETRRRLAAAYERVTESSNEFQVSLGFSDGITSLFETRYQLIVLLLDEFDEPLRELDSRVLLNLRALCDRYPDRLSYVVATNHPMREVRNDAHADEFCELFVHHTLYLGPLTEAETRAYATGLSERDHVTFDEQDIQFIQVKSGGHPGLVEAVCTILGSVTGQPVRDASQDWIIHREVSERLRDHGAVQSECSKLWGDLTRDEREGLLALVARQESPPATVLRSLKNKHLLRTSGDGVQFMGQVFEEYVRRQRIVQRGARRGIRLDVDTGEVWVEEESAPTLTRLEYRLMMLLYGNLGKICDKYQVVESVWGGDYLDEVDDARIEKLVSRLRQKLEPDPANPRYLITVRGRGYKLVDE
jgi:hypothetical protein